MSLTSLRNIIGQHALDAVLTERDAINGALCTVIMLPSDIVKLAGKAAA